MSTSREGVNPLRPYYIPPSIGDPPEPTTAPSPNPFRGGSNGAAERYASKARDLFADHLDYKDYMDQSSPSVMQSAKELVDDLMWKYTSVLMAQPFEVAKTILQVRMQDDVGGLGTSLAAHLERPRAQPSQRQASYRGSAYDEEYPNSDSDQDEPAYFASNSNIPVTPTPSYPHSSRHSRRLSSPLSSPRVPHGPMSRTPTGGSTAAGGGASAASPTSTYQLAIRRPDSVLEVIGALWQREAAWGVWKGANASFLYGLLSSLLENWTRGVLSALFNVPDLGSVVAGAAGATAGSSGGAAEALMDRLADVAAPYPWASLAVAATAALATGLLLAPLDIVRTRLLLTPAHVPPRRTLAALRLLPSYLCPPALVLPTALHSLVHPLFTLSTPLILRTGFLVDYRRVSPLAFSMARFCTSAVALAVKLPLETVLRRGQMAEVLASATTTGGTGKVITVVQPGRYKGLIGTMYHVVTEEGSRAVVISSGTKSAAKTPAQRRTATAANRSRVAETVFRRGQGMEGLWRGWKVSWWGLVGLWTISAMSASGEGEF